MNVINLNKFIASKEQKSIQYKYIFIQKRYHQGTSKL